MPSKRLTNDELLQALYDHTSFETDFLYVTSEDTIYQWNESSYDVLVPGTLEPVIHNALIELKSNPDVDASNTNVNPTLVKSIIEQLKWTLPRREDFLTTNHLAFSDNKVLNTKTFEIEEPARNKYALIKYNFPSTIVTSPPPPPIRWLQFLDEVLITPDGKPDTDMINFVQEMFGYCLLDSIKAHAAFFLTGSGQNGKSVMQDVLKALFPPHMVAASQLDELTTNRFRTATLVGKRLNIVAEEESKYLKSDVFKKIVSGDLLSAERKFHGAFEFEPRVKLIISTNNIPKFDAVDKAMRRRIYIIEFLRTFTDAEKDTELKEKLLDELPGIFHWALQGAKRVVENKYKLTRPAAIQRASAKYERNISSTIAFLNENYIVTGNDTQWVQRSDLYSQYKNWCEDENRKPLSRQRYFDEMLARYHEDGLEVPENAIYIPDFKKSLRVVLGIKKKMRDKTTWLNTRYCPPPYEGDT